MVICGYHQVNQKIILDTVVQILHKSNKVYAGIYPRQHIFKCVLFCVLIIILYVLDLSSFIIAITSILPSSQKIGGSVVEGLTIVTNSHNMQQQVGVRSLAVVQERIFGIRNSTYFNKYSCTLWLQHDQTLWSLTSGRCCCHQV